MGLSLTKKIIDKYFGILSLLDKDSKKRLIVKLTTSMEKRKEATVDLKELAGAWQDHRDSDEIISDIKMARMEKKDDVQF